MNTEMLHVATRSAVNASKSKIQAEAAAREAVLKAIYDAYVHWVTMKDKDSEYVVQIGYSDGTVDTLSFEYAE